MTTYVIKYSIYFKKTDLYQKDISKLIKVPHEIWDDKANIDFSNKDTKLVIDSVLINK